MTDLERELLAKSGYDVEKFEEEYANPVANFEVNLGDVAWIKEMHIFPLVEGVHDEILHRVYPLMQKDVENIMSAVEELPITLILFGSAITSSCHVGGDIDICVKTKVYNEKLYLRACKSIRFNCKHQCDIIF